MSGVDLTKQLYESGNESGPTCLMTCPQAGAVIAVEVLEKEEMVSPVWVRLKFLGTSINRSPPRLVFQEGPE
jgi:hypothetical protein